MRAVLKKRADVVTEVMKEEHCVLRIDQCFLVWCFILVLVFI